MNDSSTPANNPYSSPRAVSTVLPPGVLTHQFKQRNLAQMNVFALVVYCALPTIGLLGWGVLVARSVRLQQFFSFAPGVEPRSVWFGMIALIPLLIVVGTWTMYWLNQRGYRWLGRQLSTRLAEEGIDPEANGGLYVQFSPADRPAFYDHHSEWDTGYLFLFRDRLTYIGDQTRFMVRRELVLGEQAAPGGFQWPLPYQVYLDWRDPLTNRIRTFSLWDGVRSSAFLPRLDAEEFSRRLHEWRMSGTGLEAPSWSDLGPPRLDHVERKSQWEQLAGPTLIVALSAIGFLSWIVGAVISFAILDRSQPMLPFAAAAAPVIALLLQHFPLMYVRDVSCSVSRKNTEPR